VLLLQEAQHGAARGALQGGAQVAGEGRLDEEADAGARVGDLDADQVEEGAVEAVLLLEVAVGGEVAVALVADDRVADGSQVAADLVVRPPSGMTRRMEWPEAMARRR
jgi:hypothetical protein